MVSELVSSAPPIMFICFQTMVSLRQLFCNKFCSFHDEISICITYLLKVPETGRGRKPSVPKKCHSTGVNISLESVTEEDDQVRITYILIICNINSVILLTIFLLC